MTNLRVSDHAVLRYLERVGGFEIERLRAEIARCVAAQRQAGSTYVQVENIQFVVRETAFEATVSTVLIVPPRPRKRRQRRAEDDTDL